MPWPVLGQKHCDTIWQHIPYEHTQPSGRLFHNFVFRFWRRNQHSWIHKVWCEWDKATDYPEADGLTNLDISRLDDYESLIGEALKERTNNLKNCATCSPQEACGTFLLSYSAIPRECWPIVKTFSYLCKVSRLCRLTLHICESVFRKSFVENVEVF